MKVAPRSALVVLWLAAGLPACSSDGARDGAGPAHGDGGDGDGDGAAPREPLRRYEPDVRLDTNNVVSYGGDPALALPEPPRSGFRLVAPPRTLAPGEELETCLAWAYPDVKYRNVYAARVYTSGSLHHSNVYGVPLDASGKSPYPACATGQSDAFGDPSGLLAGEIPDVLFANSTQISEGEQIVFPPGMAFAVTMEGREVTTSIHWLNPTDEEVTSEVVYDFFTMPDDLVETELVPYVFQNHGFEIPAKTQGKITTTCALRGEGNFVTVMPHTHQRAVAFEARLTRPDGTSLPFYEDGQYDTDSEITVFDTPLSLAGFSSVTHTCTVNNDLERPIVWGIGDNEMCTIFGYMYPPSAQVVGGVPARIDPRVQPDCVSLPLGEFRK